MLEVWLPWQVTMGSWALTYLLHSTVFIGLAWGITRLAWLRGPHAREVIWTVALAGGIVTSAGASLGRTQGIDRREIDVELAVVRGGMPALGSSTWLESMREESIPGGGTRWLLPLFGLWLAGVSVFGGGELRGQLALRRIRRGLEPAGRRVTHALAGVTDGLRLGTVRAKVSLEVGSPCVVDSKTVVLPPRCRDELEDAELAAVLAHEVAHVMRRDVRRQSLLRVVALVLWFQPLNRFVMARLQALAELICDDWAVGRIRQPVDLARSISRVAEWSVPRSRRLPVLAGIQGGCVSHRVRRILGSKGRAGAEGRVRGRLVAVALVLSLTWLPAVPVPGSVRAVFFLVEAIQLEGGPASLDFVPTGMATSGAVHQVRVRVREAGS